MKKIAYLIGAAVLLTGSVAAVNSFAATPDPSALGASLVQDGKSAEKADRDGGKTDDKQIQADIGLVLQNDVEGWVSQGYSSSDIQAALTDALNTSGLSPDLTAALSDVNMELASLEGKKTGTFIVGSGGQATYTLAPPPPPPPGAGYTG